MKFFAGVVVTVLVVLAIGGFIFATGRFNVAANAPPDLTEKLAPWVLDKALERRAREVTDPIAKDPGAVARGMADYREDCLLCHGAPGVDAAEFQEGMNPTPPGIDATVVRLSRQGRFPPLQQYRQPGRHRGRLQGERRLDHRRLVEHFRPQLRDRAAGRARCALLLHLCGRL